mgnify:CR=1 FL=1
MEVKRKEVLKKVIDNEYNKKRKEDGKLMQSPGITAFLDKTETTVTKPGEPVIKQFKTCRI